ncbi:PREDICTED: signal transducer and activator of transcription 2 [Corvus brachyrhynchos]|uniref:signal transducer and activator of transcription 2 n=1 Tax=Corvus brachyrhynchos TaxID=85066 RepID=UPI0008166067|nr:PREDICTED: signal transducer and activator of transcription 2 [Corvus brachyrhynchos]
MMMEENIPENPLQYLYPDTPRDEAFGPYYSQRQEGTLSESQKYLNRRLIRVSSRQPSKWQTEEELVVTTENLETLQLQPGGQGAQQAGGLALPQPQSSGTPQVTPGNLGTPHGVVTTPGMGRVVATSPGIPQVTPGNLGTPQVVATSPGIPQVTPGNLGTPQMVAMSPGTLQVVATSPGALQVTPGNLGTPHGMATSPGTLQPTGMLQAQPQSLQRVGSGGDIAGPHCTLWNAKRLRGTFGDTSGSRGGPEDAERHPRALWDAAGCSVTPVGHREIS